MVPKNPLLLRVQPFKPQAYRLDSSTDVLQLPITLFCAVILLSRVPFAKDPKLLQATTTSKNEIANPRVSMSADENGLVPSRSHINCDTTDVQSGYAVPNSFAQKVKIVVSLVVISTLQVASELSINQTYLLLTQVIKK